MMPCMETSSFRTTLSGGRGLGLLAHALSFHLHFRMGLIIRFVKFAKRVGPGPCVVFPTLSTSGVFSPCASDSPPKAVQEGDKPGKWLISNLHSSGFWNFLDLVEVPLERIRAVHLEPGLGLEHPVPRVSPGLPIVSRPNGDHTDEHRVLVVLVHDALTPLGDLVHVVPSDLDSIDEEGNVDELLNWEGHRSSFCG